MELSIISRETIKPTLPHDHLQPYKLCLFDQITPMTYISLLIIYRNPDQNFNINQTQTLSHLKKSLSETLNLFYPLSGRTKENLYVDEFDSGVTYIEAKVSCSLAEFFELSQNELLNKFVPYLPLRNEVVEPSSTEELPQIGFQVSVFACGGIVLGTSFAHKVADAGTVSHLLTAWATSSRHSADDITGPNYSNASLVFPPMYSVPQKYATITNKKWFSKRNLVTKRLVFDADSIATLKELAKSDRVPRPSRNDVLTCFIWKHASAAAAAARGGAARASAAVLAVNLRPRMKSKLPLDRSLGNLFWWTRAPVSDARTVGLGELVVVLRESLVSFDECLKRSEESDDVGLALVSEYYEAMEAAFESPETDVYIFTNWSGFYNEVDFGWGKPVWIGAHGKMGGERFMKVHVLLDIPGGKGVEVFLTLEEEEMAVLEKDPKFLEFASFNPQGVPDNKEPFHRSA